MTQIVEITRGTPTHERCTRTYNPRRFFQQNEASVSGCRKNLVRGTSNIVNKHDVYIWDQQTTWSVLILAENYPAKTIILRFAIVLKYTRGEVLFDGVHIRNGLNWTAQKEKPFEYYALKPNRHFRQYQRLHKQIQYGSPKIVWWNAVFYKMGKTPKHGDGCDVFFYLMSWFLWMFVPVSTVCT